MNEFEGLEFEDWNLQVRRPSDPGPHATALLLHGLTGDEKVMGIFASRLPANYLVLSPRALFPSPAGGFSWLEKDFGAEPHIGDFQPSIERLRDLLTHGPPHLDGAFHAVHVMGFSQGAALAYGFALTHPERVLTISGLAGFLPTDAKELAAAEPLIGKKAFVSHGTEDARIPVERAREAVNILKQAGADVVYCEAQVGHKLDAGCFRALEHFHTSLAD